MAVGARTFLSYALGFAAPHPGGMTENSPTFQRWVRPDEQTSPEGTAEMLDLFGRPFAIYFVSVRGPNAEARLLAQSLLRWQFVILEL